MSLESYYEPGTSEIDTDKEDEYTDDDTIEYLSSEEEEDEEEEDEPVQIHLNNCTINIHFST